MTSAYPGGGYKSQSTLALEAIDSTKYPDTNVDFTKNMQRLNEFVDYIASYIQQMQKGIDQANESPIQKIHDLITNFIELFGGGKLLFGINFGDLQYYLPAIAALFGFSTTTPFPINLIQAVEHFVLGYVIPLQAFTSAINNLIDKFLRALGLSPEFIASVTHLIHAIGTVFGSVDQLIKTLFGIFQIFGVTSGDLGGLGTLWHAVFMLFGGFNLQGLGSIIDGPLNSLAPWINDVASAIDDLNAIIKAFTGGILSLEGIINFAGMFTPFLNFMSSTFNPLAAWAKLFASTLTGGVIPSLDASKIVSGFLSPSVLQPFIDAVSKGFGGIGGLNFGNLQTFLASLPNPNYLFTLIQQIITAIQKSLGILNPVSDITHLQANLTSALQGLLPSILGNGDGTGTLVGVGTSIIDNLDGTATLVPNVGVNSLIDNLDGTATTVAQTLQNMANGAATTVFQNLTAVAPGLHNLIGHFFKAFTGGTVYPSGTNATDAIAQTASAAQVVQQNATTSVIAVTNMAITKPSYFAVDPTADGVFPLTSIQGAWGDVLAITASTSLIGFIGIPNASTKVSICFIGQAVGTINAAYVNLYKINTNISSSSKGALTWLWSSNDISSQFTNSPQWVYCNIPNTVDLPPGSASPYLTAAQGDWYAVELQIVGTGTYEIVGIPNHWLISNPTFYPQQLAATNGAILPPAFDAIGNAVVEGTGTPLTWTHNIGTNATLLVVGLGWYGGSGNPGAPTVGSLTMTVGPSLNYAGSNPYYNVYLYYLLNPPAGLQTISVSWSGSTLCAGSVSYANVGGVGTGQNTGTSGSTTIATQVASGLTPNQQLVVQAFASDEPGVLFNYAGGNERINIPYASGINVNALLIGDTVANQPNETFSAQIPYSQFGGLALPFYGVPSGGSVPVYSATGAGAKTSAAIAGGASISWTHTFGANDTCLVVGVAFYSSTGGWYGGASIGSTPLASVAAVIMNNAPYLYDYLFGAVFPAGTYTGSQTINVTISGVVGGSYLLTGNSVSYTGATGFGQMGTATANSAAIALNAFVNGGVSEIVAYALDSNSNGSISSISSNASATNTRSNQAGTATAEALAIVDIPGQAILNISATAPASGVWGVAGIPILGTQPSTGCVLFDAKGSAYQYNAGGTSISGATWTHTSAASKQTALLVCVNVYCSGTYTSGTRSVSVDGHAMTSLCSVNTNNAAAYGGVEIFYYLPTGGLAAGSHTLSISLSGMGTIYAVYANSLSYLNVNTIASAGTTYGAAWAYTQTVNGVSGQLAVNSTSYAYGNPTPILAAAGSAMSRGTVTVAGSTGQLASVIQDTPIQYPGTAFGGACPGNGYGYGVASAILSPCLGSAPATISTPALTPNVPWFGLSGQALPVPTNPQVTEYVTAGTYTYKVPNWMTNGYYFDIVLVGAGGGGDGAQDNTNNGETVGYGGWAGSLTSITLVYGVDIPLTTTQFTVTIGAGGVGGVTGGTGGSIVGPGTAGANSTVAIPGHSTVTATGGAANTYTGTPAYHTDGVNGSFTAYAGQNQPGTTLNGVTYPAGVGSHSGHAQIPDNPIATYGSGGGGGIKPYTIGGLNGADGVCWITAYTMAGQA